ncbi:MULTISPECIES: hypothetical protein [unclassified Lentimonas]|uniref:hypothetical protein n=1 Tax=unclassified Lentimonas TaxID=2630993 RepID=UPI0013221DA2|nr:MULTISPECIES: hypothetical protein [unclassified Lentimonas]CAA6686178.1 Unannotated [Lentimonas sp. CC6]CAA7171568.1 Unannotated [Lentimonas sp. CC21]CAA6677196.1 Unannotated [Lentimonas sp. CC4]CAA7074210.1 Unannotated [Lentimonas sp. CC4]CAA7183084.1 Unannotated [Lentimonas sp. CC8]
MYPEPSNAVEWMRFVYGKEGLRCLPRSTLPPAEPQHRASALNPSTKPEASTTQRAEHAPPECVLLNIMRVSKFAV